METQGEFFADKLMDLANLAMAALVFVQLVGGQIQGRPFVIGFAFFSIAVVISFLLRRKEEKHKP